ncbi:hypothetical protein V6N00_12830 [Tersicoccus sp. MR15.9]|uniref:hypothetical protein n=1 Tax=Tersicoccus mangrovi TaxID=3121635 RepID=UPI002FE6994F
MSETLTLPEPTETVEHDQATTTGPATAAKTGAGKSNQARMAERNAKASIRRIAGKAIEVERAAGPVRALAASLLGVADDPVELTAQILGSTRKPGTALEDLSEITAAIAENKIEAAILIAAMERPAFRDVWSLLHTLGALSSLTIPAAITKSALALLTAVEALDEDARANLAAASDLLKRS